MGMTAWTEEEIERLEELKGSNMSWTAIGAELNRDPRAVRIRYQRVSCHSEYDSAAKARYGSAKLLARLKKFHSSYEIVVVVEAPKPEPQEERPTYVLQH